MRTHILTASLLLFVPLAAGCGRASAQPGDTAAASRSAVIRRVAGDCPASTGPMWPGPVGATADLNGDGYVCTWHMRSIAGDTLRLTMDNDAPGSGVQPEPYIGM